MESIRSIPPFTSCTFVTVNRDLLSDLQWSFYIDYDKEENCWLEEFNFDKEEELIQGISSLKIILIEK